MQTLIRNFSAGAVATVNQDGSPSVSPKATFVVLNESRIAFGNMRSPRTLQNLRRNPAIEICFTDILSRRAVRVSGTAKMVAKAQADETLDTAFAEQWGLYQPHIEPYVVIDVKAAEMIISPAYDRGLTEAELRKTNLEKLNSLS